MDNTNGRHPSEASQKASAQMTGLQRPTSDGDDHHSRTSIVRSWTKEDVTKWLTTNDLTLFKDWYADKLVY